MAPSRHDWKIVDWDVKPQHNQPTILFIRQLTKQESAEQATDSFFWKWLVVYAWTSGAYAKFWNLKIFNIVEE